MSKIVDLRPRNTIQNKDVRVGGATLSTKTLELFKRAYAMDKYNTPWEKAFSDYGATPDDGYSNSEHLITGTKYYFSSSTGDDSNDGLTPATAKKTVIAALTILRDSPAGTGVLFKRGDIWDASNGFENYTGYSKDAIGTVDNPMVISCWGAGDLPKFTSLASAALTWTDNGDGTWYSEDMYAPNNKISGLMLNGIWEIASSTLSGLLTEDGAKWYHDSGAGRLYINTDPAAFIDIQFAQHLSWFRFAANTKNLNISYLEIGHNRDSNIQLQYSTISNVSIHNCILGEKSNRSVIYSGVNFNFYNNIMNAKEPDSSRYHTTSHTCYGFEGLYVVIPDDAVGNISIINNTFKDFKHANILVTKVDGLKVEDNITVNITKNILTMADWLDYGGSYSIEALVNNVSFNNNLLYKVKNVQLTGTTTVEYNIFYKTKDSDLDTKSGGNIGYAIQNNQSADQPYSPNIANNVMFKCDSGGVMIQSNFNGVMDGMITEKNIMFMNGQRTMHPTATTNKGVQFMLLALDTRYTYQPINTITRDNVMFSEYTDKVIYYGRGDEQTNNENYLSIEEAQSKAYSDGTVFERNVNVDLTELVEV